MLVRSISKIRPGVQVYVRRNIQVIRKRHPKLPPDADITLIPSILQSVENEAKLSKITFKGHKRTQEEALESILQILDESVRETNSKVINNDPSTVLLPRILHTPSKFKEAMKSRNVEYLSKFANDFGRSIIEVAVLQVLNSEAVYFNYPEMLDNLDDVSKFRNTLIDELIKKKNRIKLKGDAIKLNGKTKELSWFQKIAKSFEEDMKFTMKQIIEVLKTDIIPSQLDNENRVQFWNIPPMTVSDLEKVTEKVYFSDYTTAKEDIFTLKWVRCGHERLLSDSTALLTFCENNERVLWRSVEIAQMANRLKVTASSKRLVNLMHLFELEGKLQFEIMMKRILLKIYNIKLSKDGHVKEEYQDPTKEILVYRKRQYWQVRGLEGKEKKRNNDKDNHYNMDNVTPNKLYDKIDEELLLKRFIENDDFLNRLKISVAFKSKLHHRIKNGRYIMAINASRNQYKGLSDEEIKKKLIGYFDRFWRYICLYYPTEGYAWMLSCLSEVSNTRYRRKVDPDFNFKLNQDLVELTVLDYKKMIEQMLNIGLKDMKSRTKVRENMDSSELHNFIFESIERMRHGFPNYPGDARPEDE